MSWNHRVMRHINPIHKKEMLQIHEVYYDEDGKPNGYTEDPVSVHGDDLEELGWVLDQMKVALSKPILNVEDFKESEMSVVEPSNIDDMVFDVSAKTIEQFLRKS